MRPARNSIVLLFLTLGFAASTNDLFAASLEIDVRPSFNGEPLLLDSLRYKNATGETLSITRLSYLLSGFALERTDGSWQELPDQFAWMDAAQRRTFIRFDGVPAGVYRSVRFHVGLDSTANRANPAKFAADHPLNPNLNGLHWSWQGGYIFLAIEGMWRERRAPARLETGNSSEQAEPARGAPTLDGYAYHFARDTNCTRINVAAQLDSRHDTKLDVDFDLAALLNAPHPLSFTKDGASTHSREDDPIAAALAANLPGAFRVRQIESAAPNVARGPPVKPLYLPEKFKPYQFKMSGTFPIPDLPRDNPLIEERVALGEKLFRETALSKDGKLSCASCHQASAAFSDPRRYSVGVREQTGTRNAMPLFNLAWKNSFFWDGRAPSLRAQALMPIQDHTELDETLTNVIVKLTATGGKFVAFPLTPALSPGERENRIQVSGESETAAGRAVPKTLESARKLSPLPAGEGQGEGERPSKAATAQSITDYSKLFTAAFGSPEITAEKLGLAIEQFVLTLTSYDSKFDRAMRGEEKLNANEQRGFELFMTEYEPRTGRYGADCFHCHGGALFSDHQFHNNGLGRNDGDLGRFKVTKLGADNGKFSTPSLRNVALTAPYMHDGRFATLEEVVEHYSNGVKRDATLDPNLAKHPEGGLRLSANDKGALVSFLKSLTDEKYCVTSKP